MESTSQQSANPRRGCPELEGKELSDLVTFDCANEGIKRDVLHMIGEYLYEQGLTTAAHTLRAEAKLKERDRENRKSHNRKMTAAILDGDWEEVNRLLGKNTFKHLKALHYALAKQQYLELIESGDGQKAYSSMKKKLKPLEAYAPEGEFQALAYLLTCKSVRDAPGGYFSDWDEESGRQRLILQFKHFLDPDSLGPSIGSREPPPGRLCQLLHQACGYQVLSQPPHPTEKPHIATLAHDYQAPLCPNVKTAVLLHHTPVKCCEWVGNRYVASGAGDGSVVVWELEREPSTPANGGSVSPPRGVLRCAAPIAVLAGHDGRVWSLATIGQARIASGSADGTIRVWDMTHPNNIICTAVLTGHVGDVYSVKGHPSSAVLLSGGYDCTVRIFSLSSHQQIMQFTGHSAPVTCVRFNHYGNLAISGSKDGTIRFWEVASGICLQIIGTVQTAAAVTSIDISLDGGTLLVGYQDSCNRVFDLTTGREPELLHLRFQSHTNSSKNLIRACFGPPGFVFSGSEDGSVCIWSSTTGCLVSRLMHTETTSPSTVYEARWCKEAGRLASCGDDNTVCIWEFDRSQPCPPPQ